MKKNTKKLHKKIISTMLFAIVLSFLTYSYAIASTTLSVSDMKSRNSEIQDLETEIAELEVQYFGMINSISVKDAEIYGMNEITAVGYASLDQETVVAYNL